jgi:hypothetical protein
MKRIIDGKLYDTDQAKLIAEMDNGLPQGDLYHVREALYLTRNGAWFLAGKGGAASTRWAKDLGQGSTCQGGGIIALDEEEAAAWAEGNAEADVMLEYFSRYVENA